MELNENIIKSAYKLMEINTKGYQWYTDTPEQPFEYTEGSIWLINPETEEWMLELQKDGHLWYHDKIFDTFSKYLNMKKIDFESFIGLWVEDALKRGVVSTTHSNIPSHGLVEDALKRGVVSTAQEPAAMILAVEDVLERGVVSTDCQKNLVLNKVEDVLERGVVSTDALRRVSNSSVEDVLERGVVSTCSDFRNHVQQVKDVIENGKQWN